MAELLNDKSNTQLVFDIELNQIEESLWPEEDDDFDQKGN